MGEYLIFRVIEEKLTFFFNTITPGFASYLRFLSVFMVKKKKKKIRNEVVILCQVETMKSEIISLKGICICFIKH